MRKLTILIDMDDVLDNLLEAWVSELNDLYGMSVDPNDINDWDLSLFFKGISTRSLYMPLFWERFWEGVKPKEGAVEGVEKLLDDGHEVFVVTAAHPNTISTKLNKCLFKYFPCITRDEVIVTSHKQMIVGDVLIDDAPHNLIGGKYIGILFGAPHNAKYEAEKNGLIRANSWDEVYNIISKIAQEEQA